jgi:hypothetical protein
VVRTLPQTILSDNSYVVIERNWRCGRLEVDIIARYNETLVIGEVKPGSAISLSFPRNLLISGDKNGLFGLPMFIFIKVI